MGVTTAEKVKLLRTGRGWSQVRLAAEARCDKETVNRIELGAGWRDSTLEKIAVALGQKKVDLISDDAIAEGTYKLSPEEQELLSLWRSRRLPDVSRIGILEMLRGLAGTHRKRKTA